MEIEFKLKNLDKKAFAIDIYSINGQKSESPYGVYSCNNSIEINKELIRVLSEGPDKDGLFKVYVKGNHHMRFKPLERRKKMKKLLNDYINKNRKPTTLVVG